MSNFSKQTTESPKVSCPLHFRPALRAGVKCGDITALSYSFFEPSALPWPWAFSRSLIRQNRGQEGGNAQRRGWVDLPGLSAFPLELFPILVGEVLVPHGGTQRSQHRASLSWRYTGATQPTERAQTAPKGADGRSAYEAAPRQDYAIISPSGKQTEPMATYENHQPNSGDSGIIKTEKVMDETEIGWPAEQTGIGHSVACR